jgi:hypothetical protein
MTSLNVSRSSGDLWPGLNEPKGYSSLLILAVDDGMEDPRWLSRQGRRYHGGAPGPQRRHAGVGWYRCSGPLNMMRCSPTASRRCGELVLLPSVDGGRWCRLTTVAHLAPLLGSTCSGSKGSLGSKIGERWRRLLPELVASFNCGENRQKMARDEGG